jgi:Pentapeptide repeats (8 copies)
VNDVDFSGANLSGANLSTTRDLTQDQLEEAYGDKNTTLPPDLKPPAHWDVKTDEQIERG